MQIQWLGLAAFKIQTTNSVIVIDPYNDSAGLIMPKLKADVILVSDSANPIANNIKRLSGEGFLITGPGEYEICTTFIYGLAAAHTLYLIEENGISLAFLGSSAVELTNEQLEKIEGTDILLLPLSNVSKEQRTTIISQVEPRVIIPYLYQQPKVKQALTPLATFLKEMGIKEAVPQEKYSIKAKDLPADETKVIILQSMV